MEGVGARLGRSSTRYGPTTVFTGPVRKWKKKWVHVSPSNATASSNHHTTQASNGNSNGNGGGSHLLLYKWTPISQSHSNGNSNGSGDAEDDDATPTEIEEPPRRKLKYIPVAVLEQKSEDAEPTDDELQPIDTDAAEPNSKNTDEKPDINDIPIDENQDSEDTTPQPRQDLNESLDLSLG